MDYDTLDGVGGQHHAPAAFIPGKDSHVSLPTHKSKYCLYAYLGRM